MKTLPDLPAELQARCLAGASDGDPAWLLAICATHPALLRLFRPALLSLQHVNIDGECLQRFCQFGREDGAPLSDEIRIRKLAQLLRAIEGVKSLALIDIDFEQRIEKMQELLATVAEQTSLTDLTLFDMFVPVGSLEQLKHLPALEVLDLSGSGEIYVPTRHHGLLHLVRLKELYLDKSVLFVIKAEDVAPIAGNLRVLHITHTDNFGFSDAFCALLTACEELDVRHSWVAGSNLQVLAQHATKLLELTVSLRPPVLTQSDVDKFRGCRPDVLVEIA